MVEVHAGSEYQNSFRYSYYSAAVKETRVRILDKFDRNVNGPTDSSVE